MVTSPSSAIVALVISASVVPIVPCVPMLRAPLRLVGWWPRCRPGWWNIPDPSMAVRSGGSNGPFPIPAPTRCGCRSGCAASAAPIFIWPRGMCRPAALASPPAMRSSAWSTQLGPGCRPLAHRRPGRRALAGAHLWRLPLLHFGTREPLRGAALHRVGRRRRLRRLRAGRGGVRLRAARSLRRRRGGAAPLRGHHRLPRLAPGRSARGWDARHLRLRRVGPPHGPGCAGPRRSASTS